MSERTAKRLVWIALCLFSLLSLWGIRHLFEAGIPTGWDTAGHYLKAWYLREHLLPAGQTDGWFPLWHGGFQLFQFYPPLFYYLSALPSLLTFGWVPVLSSFKWMMALSYALLPLAVYIWSRGYGFGRAAALCAAAAVPLVGSVYGSGLRGLFLVGLVPNALGLLLTPLVLWAYHQAHEREGVRSRLVCGLLVAAVLLTHTFTTYYLAGALALYSVLRWLHGMSLKQAALRAFSIAGVALAVGAWWWVPLLLKYGLHGQFGSWDVGGMNDPGWITVALLDGRIIGDRLVSVLGLVGLGFLPWRRFEGRFLGILTLVTALLGFGTITKLLPFAEVIGSAQFPRFQAFLTLLWALLAGVGAASSVAWLLKGGLPARIMARVCQACMVGAFALYSLPNWQYWIDGSVRLHSNYGDNQAVMDAGNWLWANSRPGSRYISQFEWRGYHLYGTPHSPSQLIPLVSGRSDLGGNFPEGAAITKITDRLPRIFSRPRPIEIDLASRLRRYGVDHVVAVNGSAELNLQKLKGFKKAFLSRRVTVFQLDPPSPLLTGDVPVSVTGVQEGVNRITYSLASPAGNPIVIPINSYPNWRATYDGRPIELEETNDFLMRIVAPKPGPAKLELRFEWLWWEHGVRLFSLASLLAVLVLGWRLRRKAFNTVEM